MSEKGGAFQKVLSIIGRCLPGERFKTGVYLSCIAGPRRVLRKTVNGFYRIDHVYEVLREFKNGYDGQFSILEFGVADGYAFTKKLYAVKHLRIQDRIMVHGFDTFEGLPALDKSVDMALVGGDDWVPGTYVGRYNELQAYCERKYDNFCLHKGMFDDTLTESFLESLLEYKPILIWIDCDYYSSTRSVFLRLIPYIPTGCVVYFDDIYFNFSSKFTGEMRAVAEINNGAFGEGLELVLDRHLTWDSNRVYRFINLNSKKQHVFKNPGNPDRIRFRGDDSPFP